MVVSKLLPSFVVWKLLSSFVVLKLLPSCGCIKAVVVILFLLKLLLCVSVEYASGSCQDQRDKRKPV